MGSSLHSTLISLRNFICDTIATILIPIGPSTHTKDEILLVKLFPIGDFVLWLDAAEELRRLYPPEKCRLVLIGNAIWTDLAKQLPYFDEVISVDKKRLCYDARYRFKMWRFLRERTWSTVVSSDYSREFFCGDSIVRVSAALERIGFQGDLSNQSSWQKRISNKWYTRLIPSSDQPLMELERNAEFIRGLGSQDFQSKVPRLDIPAILPVNFTVVDYFVVVPGAGDPFKRWPLDFFTEIVTRISTRYAFTPVICGAPGEKILGARLLQSLTGPVDDWSGKTSLREMVAIIRGARFVLGNDSGAMHIAAAVGTPAFCIVGGGHWGRFVPYNLKCPTTPLPVPIVHHMDCFYCNWKCKFNVAEDGPVRCIERVSVDDVWSAIRKIEG